MKKFHRPSDWRSGVIKDQIIGGHYGPPCKVGLKPKLSPKSEFLKSEFGPVLPNAPTPGTIFIRIEPFDPEGCWRELHDPLTLINLGGRIACGEAQNGLPCDLFLVAARVPSIEKSPRRRKKISVEGAEN